MYQKKRIFIRNYIHTYLHTYIHTKRVYTIGLDVCVAYFRPFQIVQYRSIFADKYSWNNYLKYNKNDYIHNCGKHKVIDFSHDMNSKWIREWNQERERQRERETERERERGRERERERERISTDAAICNTKWGTYITKTRLLNIYKISPPKN